MANPIFQKVTSLRQGVDLHDDYGNWAGYLGVGETFATHSNDRDGYGQILSYAYTTKGFIKCWPQGRENYDYHVTPAYSRFFADKVTEYSTFIRCYFNTRRTIRIYSGTTLIDTIPSGSRIQADGYSTAGATHPDRLLITGYQRAGSQHWYFQSNMWAETGIKAGYYTWPSIINN